MLITNRHYRKELKLNSLNKKLALILWGEDANGEPEVAVFSGVLVEKNKMYFLDREDEKNSAILKEWIPRITKVPEDLKEILMDSEYQLSLLIGDIEDTSASYESFGLKWPSK